MQLFDAHNHIQEERLFSRLNWVMDRARAAGICRMGVKGCSEADWGRVEHIVNNFDCIFPAFGIHPWFISGRSVNWTTKLENLLTSYPQASVGEIGIDHAVENRDDADQEAVFLAQLELARKFDRPVTIHCRQAWGRLIELLDQFGDLPKGMMIHCFGGSAEVAMELVRRGAYISFSGSITRPNNKKAEPALRAVPADRLLIETDAPDIFPCNMVQDACLCEDGQILNEPANLRAVLAKAAAFRGVSQADLAELTFENAERFFGGE